MTARTALYFTGGLLVGNAAGWYIGTWLAGVFGL